MDNFYITVYDRVVALSQRNGLAESVGGDAERRRVMYYDDDYANGSEIQIRLRSVPLYMLMVRVSADFIQPWLDPQNYLSSFIGNFDQFVITTELQNDGETLNINLTNFEQEVTERPKPRTVGYSRWVMQKLPARP
jgi:hypothetical protein